MRVRLAARVFANAGTLEGSYRGVHTPPLACCLNLLLRQVGDDFGERFVSEGKRHLLAAVTGFLIRAEAAEGRRLRSPKEDLKVRDSLLAGSGRVASQQGFVAPRIDLDPAQSFQQARDALTGAVCPRLERHSLN